MALNSITFDYNARSSVQNFGVKPCELNGVNSAQQTISGKQFFEYQAGLSGRTGKDIMNIFTGEMDDNSFGGMKFRTVQLSKPDTRSADRSFSIKTSFNLPAPLDVQFSTISLGWSKSVRLTTDTSSRDTTQTFPDLTIGARTGMLNKLPFVMTNFQSLQCNSNFNMNKKSQNTITSSQTNNMKSTAMNFSPLVGLDGTLKKWPVKVNYVHNLSVKTDENSGNQNVTSTLTNDDKVGAQYEIQKANFGKEDIKFLFWKIPVKGRIVTGLDVTRSSTDVKMGTSVDNLAQTSANSTLSISPNASYDFTDNITGATKYEYSQKKGDSQTLTSNIFSLSVEIRF